MVADNRSDSGFGEDEVKSSSEPLFGFFSQIRPVQNQKKYKDYLKKVSIKKNLPKLQVFHSEAFKLISCLDCGACCKGYSPRFKNHDIVRAAAVLGLKPEAFIKKYLYPDEENDLVLKSLPCPFIDKDNRCIIYEERPGDCRKYPYTDEDTFLKKKDITLKNVTICPAAFFVLEKLISSE